LQRNILAVIVHFILLVVSSTRLSIALCLLLNKWKINKNKLQLLRRRRRRGA